jgi:predicted secreted Zn-dependent protease
MNVLLAAVLATALAAGTDDEIVQRVHARIVGYDVAAASCHVVFAGVAEPGSALFDFRYQITGVPHNGRYRGNVTFSLGDVTIRLPRSIVWKGMSEGDRERVNALRRAIYHHEAGHVRIAEAVRDALNAGDTINAPDRFAFSAAADAAGRDGFDRFKREEREYDALTDHGRKQHLAPGEFAGPDTALICPAMERTRARRTAGSPWRNFRTS